MRGGIAVLIGFAAIIGSSAALAMSGSGTARFGPCTVVGTDNLPAPSGGSEALCGAIERAIRAHAPTAKYRVEVKVISGSRLSAALVVNGQALPDQRFAVMDGHLSSASVGRFAEAVATAVAEAAKR